MALYATAEEGPPQLAPGTYEITCIDIREDQLENVREPDVWRFYFETADVLDGNGNPVQIDGIASRRLTPKSKAWAWCEALGLKPEIGKRIDLEEVIGGKALAKIINKPGRDGTGAFARIDSIMPPVRKGSQTRQTPADDDLGEWWKLTRAEGLERDKVLAKSQELFENREPKDLTAPERAELMAAML